MARGGVSLCARSLSARRAPKQAGKRIFLVTDNDNPVDDSEQLIEVAMNKRRVSLYFIFPFGLSEGEDGYGADDRWLLRQDLSDMRYDIEPFFIPPTEDSAFDLSRFYGVRLLGSPVPLS